VELLALFIRPLYCYQIDALIMVCTRCGIAAAVLFLRVRVVLSLALHSHAPSPDTVAAIDDEDIFHYDMEESSSVPQAAIQRSSEADRPFVFFLGLQKAGSTSFAYFMSTAMGAETLHSSEWVYKVAGFDNKGPKACVNDTNGPRGPKWEPDYKSVAAELDRNQLTKILKYAGVKVFADHPWPLVFQWLDKYHPNSKFVFWERNSSDWVKSAKKYFSDPRYAGQRRMMTLDYGNCDLTKIPDEQLEAVYQGHTTAVRNYFTGPSAPASRKVRFLDFALDGPTAAKELCNFVDYSGVSCASMGRMPKENDRNGL